MAIFSEKGLVSSKKIAILGQITHSTATYITLLPPLLPPLNFLIIRIIPPKVAVVAVKSIICLVKGLLGYWVKGLFGYWVIQLTSG